jgi:tetratricopeptide (TPR) repeat protein
LTADSISGSRVLCLLTHRSSYVPPFSDRTYHTRLPLPALSATDALQIAHTALATDQLPEELRTLIAQKAEGNPFFVEEVVKSLREAGAIRREGDRYVAARPLNAMVVPDTIQDVLAARIDRVAEASKRTLQLASVIGREFPRRLLERMTDTPQHLQSELQDLKTLELIREKQLVPELVYVFKHALTQDVAYHSLLASRRQAWHRLVGRTIEELYADRLTEQYGMLAHHFAQGQDWAKALEYLLKAAEKAAQTFATREAIALYDQALEAARQLEPKPDLHALLKVRQAKAALLFATSDFAGGQAESAELLTLARCLADRRGEASALVSLGWAKAYSHDFAQALNAAHQAQRIGEEDNASSILAGSHALAGFVHMVTGRLEQGRAEMGTALTLGRSTQNVTAISLSLYGTGLLRNWEGNYADAVRVQAEGIAIAREHNLVSPLIRNLFVHGFTLTAMGNYDGALVTLEEGLMLSEKVGNALYHYRLLNCLGRLYLELGDLERAAHFNRKSAEGARQRRDPETLANAELNLGDCLLAQGDLAGAQELLEGIYRLSHDPSTSEWMKWRYSIHLFASLGELWLARGDAAKARESAERCLEIASRTRSRKYEVKCWRLLGEIDLAHRQHEQAESFLQRALTLAQAVGHPPELWKTHLALSRLHGEAKRPQQAQQAYEAARATLELVRAGVQNPVLRARLERSPLIHQT